MCLQNRDHCFKIARGILIVCYLLNSAAAQCLSPAGELTPLARQTEQSALSASDELGEAIGFAEAVKLALEGNYDLRGLRSQSASLNFRAHQALSPNSPTFTYSRNDLDGFTPAGVPYSEQYVISYTLGFPGKALASSAGLRHQSESAGDDSASKEIDLIVLLGSNFAAQKANRELDKILSAEVQNANSLIQLQETRYARAQAAQAEIMGSRVSLARLQQTYLANTNEFLALKTDFINILGRPAKHYTPRLDDELTAPRELPSEPTLDRLMTAHRPALRSLAHLAQASESALTNSRLAPLPDLTFSAGLNQYTNAATAPVSGLGRSYNLGVSVTLPLFFPFNEVQGIRAAKSDVSIAENKMKATQVQAASDLASAYLNYKALLEEIYQLEKTVIPAAKAYYELGRAAYSSGRSDFLRLNDARATYLSAQFDFIAKKKQLQTTFYQLVQLVGCDFTKSVGTHACE